MTTESEPPRVSGENVASQRSADAEALALEIRRLAHDLNNALMPILLGVEALRRKAPDPALERTMGNIEGAARRANELADKILKAARGDEGASE